MIAPLLAFVAGATVLQSLPQLPPAGILLTGLPLWLIGRSFTGRVRWVGVVLLALLFGLGWAGLRAHWRMADRLAPEWEGREIELRGVVAELPQPTERGVRLRLDVEQVWPDRAIIPGHIQLSDYQPARRDMWRAGQRWLIRARLRQPHATHAPHTFDAERWMLQQGIRATGTVRSARLADDLVWRPAYLLHRLRDQLRRSMLATLGPRPYAGLVTALVMGDQQAIPAAQWTIFARTGLTHLVSISGLHITLVAAMVAASVHWLWRRRAARLLRLPARKAGLLAGMLAAAGYALLAGYSVPTQRTLYMLLIAGWALWSGRSLSIWQILCLALAGVVLLDPWAVLAPGFWLSFGAVAWLIRAELGRLQPASALRRWAGAQWAVTLGLAPALLLLFQQLPLISPLANAWAIPLIGTLATPLCLLGALLPPLLPLAHGLIELTMQPMVWLAGWPQLQWQQAAPPHWSLGLALPAIVWLTQPRGWPARWLALPALLPLCWPSVESVPPGEFRLSMLDVGQGTAVVVQTARHTLLYDTGPAFGRDSDSGIRIVLPWLRGEGLAQLDGLVLSHDDADHTGGAASVLNERPPRWLLHTLPDRHPLLAGGAHPVRCQAGRQWQWDGVVFQALAPVESDAAGPPYKDNDLSCVIRIVAGCGKVLLTGDIERRAEQWLLQHRPDALAAEVLLVPHHGSKTSSGRDFIDAVAARHALVSAGYRNRFGHPRADVLQRYLDTGATIHRTDLHGTVGLSCGAHGWQVSRSREQQARYWQAGHSDPSGAD